MAQHVQIGGPGSDTLVGTSGNDFLAGEGGVDTLTGNGGHNVFAFDGQDLEQGPHLQLAGLDVVNTPDVITDYKFGNDHVLLNAADFGVSAPEHFQDAPVANLTGDANVVVLQDSFANGAVAANAIAANTDFHADHPGFFVYFNNQLGLDRLVYDNNLSHPTSIQVLANFQGHGQGDAPSFSASDFVLGHYDAAHLAEAQNAMQHAVHLDHGLLGA